MVRQVLVFPPGTRLRPDAALNNVKLAVGRALTDKMDESSWRELALTLDVEDAVLGHHRLLRALRFGDDDYAGSVLQVVPALLGLRTVGGGFGWGPDTPTEIHLDHADAVEDYLELPDWLAQHDPKLYRLLYVADLAQANNLDEASTLAQQLDLPEIIKQLDRLSRDLPAAIGHAKDLVESACKTILGQTGPGAGGNGPALVGAALSSLGRQPGQVDGADPDAQLLRRLLGATSSQLEGVFGLRNRFGIGQGRAGDVVVDEPLARLTIGQTINAVTYLLRVHAQQTPPSPPTAAGTRP